MTLETIDFYFIFGATGDAKFDLQLMVNIIPKIIPDSNSYSRLKCDRGNPCDNCIKRDLAASCTFIHAAAVRAKPAQAQRSVNGHNQKDIHDRIRHLEGLVVSLMQQQPPSTPHHVSLAANNTATSPPKAPYSSPTSNENTALDNASSSLGLITIEDNQSKYIGGSHWAAILDSVHSTPFYKNSADMCYHRYLV